MRNNTNIVLIADSGSTKTDWLLLKGKDELSRFSTQGINPFMLTESEITTILATELPQLPASLAGQHSNAGQANRASRQRRRTIRPDRPSREYALEHQWKHLEKCPAY